MDLQKKKEELEDALKQTEAQYLKIQGALIVVNELIKETEQTDTNSEE
jgi:hypothetical protein